jgi:hypothetical protein
MQGFATCGTPQSLCTSHATCHVLQPNSSFGGLEHTMVEHWPSSTLNPTMVEHWPSSTLNPTMVEHWPSSTLNPTMVEQWPSSSTAQATRKQLWTLYSIVHRLANERGSENVWLNTGSCSTSCCKRIASFQLRSCNHSARPRHTTLHCHIISTFPHHLTLHFG